MIQENNSDIIHNDKPYVEKQLDIDTVNKSWTFKKNVFILIVLIINLGLGAFTVFTDNGLWIIIPFITLAHVRDIIFILFGCISYICCKYRVNWGTVNNQPEKKTTICSLVTCYAEPYNIVSATIKSMEVVNKEDDVTKITNFIICITDGRLVALTILYGSA
jgi:hypothetical protein